MKRKIAMLLKKEPSGFVSVQFRSCLQVSPFGYCSDVWVWYKPMSGAVHVWCIAAFSELQEVHSLWLLPLGLAAPRVDRAALQSWLLSALGPGVYQQLSQVANGSASAFLFLLGCCQSYTGCRPDYF